MGGLGIVKKDRKIGLNAKIDIGLEMEKNNKEIGFEKEKERLEIREGNIREKKERITRKTLRKETKKNTYRRKDGKRRTRKIKKDCIKNKGLLIGG